MLLALPASVFIGITAEGGRATLELTPMIKHVNQHQVSCCLYLIFFKGVRFWVFFSYLFGFTAEERVFSLRFAAVPSDRSLPEGENRGGGGFLQRNWNLLSVVLPGSRHGSSLLLVLPL